MLLPQDFLVLYYFVILPHAKVKSTPTYSQSLNQTDPWR